MIDLKAHGPVFRIQRNRKWRGEAPSTTAGRMFALVLDIVASLTAVSLASTLTLVAASPATAETVDGSRIIVIDADTVALPCTTPAPGCSERIRFVDIDAPETWRPHCDDEQQMGFVAKDRLREILKGHTVTVTRTGRVDPYRRTLANLSTDEGDVGQLLLREQLALPYRPGAAAKAERIAHWCGEAKPLRF